MSDEFFSKIDAQLGQIARTKAREEADRARNASLSSGIVERCAAVIQNYVPKLVERGLTPKVSAHSSAASFELRDNDGFGFGVTAYLNQSTGRMEFSSELSDEGKRYKSDFGGDYDASNWSEDDFRRKIEDAITSYMQMKVRKSTG